MTRAAALTLYTITAVMPQPLTQMISPASSLKHRTDVRPDGQIAIPENQPRSSLRSIMTKRMLLRKRMTGQWCWKEPRVSRSNTLRRLRTVKQSHWLRSYSLTQPTTSISDSRHSLLQALRTKQERMIRLEAMLLKSLSRLLRSR